MKKPLSNSNRQQRFALERFLLKGISRFALSEIKNEGLTNFVQTVRASAQAKELRFSSDRSLGEELDVRAKRLGEKTFLSYQDQRISYRQLNENAARVAQFLTNLSADEDTKIGILLPNLPAFLEIFFATQRIGACVIPTNTALVDEGLAYIINNSGMTFVFTTRSHLTELAKVQPRLNQALTIVVVDDPLEDVNTPALSTLEKPYITYRQALDSPPQVIPKRNIPAANTSMLMYTSGTTGHPKGVVYPYGFSPAKKIRVVAHLIVDKDDIYFTCLPLFHANALIITCLSCLYGDAQIALARRFSASQFWQQVQESNATITNTLGTMIAILMKQPPKASDTQHKLKRIISAACPADLWQDFETRFSVKLIESFGAVDGGGLMIMNVGNAPIGSIGKPIGKVKWKLVDDNNVEVPIGSPGELVHYVGDEGCVNYHANKKASSEKSRHGWVYSGDIMRADQNDFLYFVGRNTDSMRCGGENVSALEVETAVNQHPSVLESAAFGIPSELAEEDIMVVVQPKQGQTVDPIALSHFLREKLPKYAQPKYIRIVNQLPKTETHRIIKHLLKQAGVTNDTVVIDPRSTTAKHASSPHAGQVSTG